MISRQDADDAARPNARDVADAPAHVQTHAELARLRQNSFVLRTVAIFGVAALVALFSIRERPRFMFVVPLVALLSWTMDGAVTRGVRVLERQIAALRDAASAGAHTLGAVRSTEPYLRNVLHPRVAVVYFPLALVAGLISVDAPAIQPGDRPSELTWYVLVVGTAAFALLLVVIAWISELAARGTVTPLRPPAPTPVAFPLPPASARPFPSAPVPSVVPSVVSVRSEAPVSTTVPPAPPVAGPFPPSAPPVSIAPPSGETLVVAPRLPAPTFTPPVTLAGVGNPAPDDKPRADPTQSFGTLIE